MGNYGLCWFWKKKKQHLKLCSAKRKLKNKMQYENAATHDDETTRKINKKKQQFWGRPKHQNDSYWSKIRMTIAHDVIIYMFFMFFVRHAVIFFFKNVNSGNIICVLCSSQSVWFWWNFELVSWARIFTNDKMNWWFFCVVKHDIWNVLTDWLWEHFAHIRTPTKFAQILLNICQHLAKT